MTKKKKKKKWCIFTTHTAYAAWIIFLGDSYLREWYKNFCRSGASLIFQVVVLTFGKNARVVCDMLARGFSINKESHSGVEFVANGRIARELDISTRHRVWSHRRLYIYNIPNSHSFHSSPYTSFYNIYTFILYIYVYINLPIRIYFFLTCRAGPLQVGDYEYDTWYIVIRIRMCYTNLFMYSVVSGVILVSPSRMIHPSSLLSLHSETDIHSCIQYYIHKDVRVRCRS